MLMLSRAEEGRVCHASSRVVYGTRKFTEIDRHVFIIR